MPDSRAGIMSLISGEGGPCCHSVRISDGENVLAALSVTDLAHMYNMSLLNRIASNHSVGVLLGQP